MPLYTFQCTLCDDIKVLKLAINDLKDQDCELCAPILGTMVQVIGTPFVCLNGSGFYKQGPFK